MEQGPEWKEARTKLNPGLFAVKDANSYLELELGPTAARASASFPRWSDDLMGFSQRAGFDMFCAAVLGRSLDTCRALEIDGPADGMSADELAAVERRRQVGEAFIARAVAAFNHMGALLFNPRGEAAARASEDLPKFMEEMFAARDISEQMVNLTIEEDAADAARRGGGGGDDAAAAGRGSYLQGLLQSGHYDAQTASAVVMDLLLASVDTTTTVLSWLLYNIARSPDAQAKMAAELASELRGGPYCKEAKLPYTTAVYRESHRLSPIGATSTLRETPAEVELGGYAVPAGTRVWVAGAAIQRDPALVGDDCDAFRPERWLPDAVAARKGTPAEVLDHKLLATPFSFGPRMCLGARLARNEIFALATQIVQDYEMELVAEVGSAPRLMVQLHPSPAIRLTPRNRRTATADADAAAV